MRFNYYGYELKFIQKEPCRDESVHQYSLIYKFFSPVTKYHYVLRAEFHDEGVFAIKFYCKAQKRSEKKYSKIVNRGDLGNILMTCLKVIPMLLSQEEYENVSFGFAGARTIDKRSKKAEGYINNQRFRIYSQLISSKIGSQTFAHFEYEHVSSYLLVNRGSGDPNTREREIITNLIDTYTDLHDL